jgi:hypothetical protein
LNDKETAIHVIRYDYDETRDEVPTLPHMHLEVRLPRPYRSVKAFGPTGAIRIHLTFSREQREVHLIELEDVPMYAVILLQ